MDHDGSPANYKPIRNLAVSKITSDESVQNVGKHKINYQLGQSTSTDPTILTPINLLLLLSEEKGGGWW